MGRKKLPVNIKLLKGTLRKHREITNAPKPNNANIIKPEMMSHYASEFWDQVTPELIDCKVITSLDVPALNIMCEAYAHYHEAMEELKSTGLVILNKNGESKSPYLAIANKAYDQLVGMFKEFGLTPASRPHIQTVQDKPVNDFDEF